MYNKTIGSQLISPLQVSTESDQRFTVDRLVRSGEINQVGGMNDYRADIFLMTEAMKPLELLRIDGLALPAPWIPAEDLDRLAPGRFRASHRLRNSSRD